MSARTTRYATRKGYAISRAFTGRGVAIVMPESPARGRAQVWVDGSYVRTLDLYRGSFAPRRVMYNQTWTSAATHTIKVVVLGTSGRPRVDLDAVVIIN